MIRLDASGLWSSVIGQAIRDYNNALHGRFNRDGVPMVVNDMYPTREEAEEARQFLTDNHGEWARSRLDICAGVLADADILRERVLTEVRERGNLDRMVRSLNGYADAQPSKKVD